jgi:hypothetical protein
VRMASETFTQNHKPIKEYYEHPKYTPLIILDEKDSVLGYVWTENMDFVKEKQMYVDFIEVIDKENGTGTRIIEFLFNQFELFRMFGTVLRERSERAYFFWESLGSIFDCTLEEADETGLDINFSLSKSNFFQRNSSLVGKIQNHKK